MRQGEFGYLNWIRRQLKYSRSVLVGSGDDAAVIRINKQQSLLVTCDTIVEGVDFKLKQTSAHQVGHKALAISLSDLAAMGGVDGPIYAVIAVALKSNISDRFARDLFQGMKKLADKFKVEIIGGDVSSTRGPITITSTVLGKVNRLKPILRLGAKVGDAIMVTGSLGGSIRGKHLDFIPRLNEAKMLNRNYDIHSLIDISDGLLLDLNHILTASTKGALLYEMCLPVSNDARFLARGHHKKAIKGALDDGEDFELLFTLPMKQAIKLVKKPKPGLSCILIGKVIKSPGIYLAGVGKRISRIKPQGYEHWKK